VLCLGPHDSIGGVAPPMSSPALAPTASGTGVSRSTGFGNTVFDVVAPNAPRQRGLTSAFDVCHVGVVLRALLFVHGAMAIGMVFAATSLAAWLALTAAGASVALPAVLLWLLVLCALKVPLARAPLAAQWAIVAGLGALAAFGASRLIAMLLPDAPGNNRLDTLANVAATGRVGLLFLIPGIDETLRVNGTARVSDDSALLAPFLAERHPPRVVLAVEVREAYLHCAKAFMRSQLWSSAAQVERSVLPTLGEMLKDQTGAATPPETQEAMLARYAKDL